MRVFAKIIAVFANLCTYGVGAAVLFIKLLKKDFIAVFIISGFNYNESLFFNMALFSLGTALLGIVMTMLADEYKTQSADVVYPIIFAILPAVVSAFFIYFGVTGDAAREVIVMLASTAVYLAASLVNVYTGTKIFTVFSSDKKKSE